MRALTIWTWKKTRVVGLWRRRRRSKRAFLYYYCGADDRSVAATLCAEEKRALGYKYRGHRIYKKKTKFQAYRNRGVRNFGSRPVQWSRSVHASTVANRIILSEAVAATSDLVLSLPAGLLSVNAQYYIRAHYKMAGTPQHGWSVDGNTDRRSESPEVQWIGIGRFNRYRLRYINKKKK